MILQNSLEGTLKKSFETLNTDIWCPHHQISYNSAGNKKFRCIENQICETILSDELVNGQSGNMYVETAAYIGFGGMTSNLVDTVAFANRTKCALNAYSR